MNYYNRITDVISGDQIIAESQEQQERIDELLGRIGRAMGTLLSSKPANPYTGQWNPLRGKYEGGLNADDRRAAIRARVAAKKKDATPAPKQPKPKVKGRRTPKPKKSAKKATPMDTSKFAKSDAPLPGENESTYYGYITKLIRESFQLNEKKGPCWKGYEAIGMKMKGERKVPNCVPKSK